MKRELVLPEDESAGLLFAAPRAYCLYEEDIEWLGEAIGRQVLPDVGYAGIILNCERSLRRQILQDLDLTCLQIVYFFNPFQFRFDDLLLDLGRLGEVAWRNCPDDDDCALLAGLPGLRAVNLTESKVTDEGLKQLSEVLTLESLVLSGTEITDAGLQRISALVDLKELDLSLTLVSDDGLPRLTGLKALEELRLCATGVSEEGIVSLLKLQNLKFLDLAETAVSEEGLAVLQAGLGYCQIDF
jgi:hypothetical protein